MLRPDDTTFTLATTLVVAGDAGKQSHLGNERFAQWAPGRRIHDDALTIRQRLFTAFEIAETAGAERDDGLTFGGGCGGPTGVELAGRDPRDGTLSNEFHSIQPQDASSTASADLRQRTRTECLA